jgi:archaemetzincin
VTRPRIVLVEVSPEPLPVSLDELGEDITAIISGWEWTADRLAFDAYHTFDVKRGNYDSLQFLYWLDEQMSKRETPGGASRKTIGLTTLDLGLSVLTFVFGQAFLGGKTALVSTHRLKPELYGLPADDALFYSRVLKECIHELGHTMGLPHCRESSCILRGSTYVEELDILPTAFCSRCQERINEIDLSTTGLE